VGTSSITRIAAGAAVGLLVIGAFAVAGCGGSSSTTTAAAGGGTTSTSSTTGAGPTTVPPSTAIDSSAYFNGLVQAFSQKGKLSQSQAESAAHCIQDGLTKAGFKTQGDAEGANAKKALKIVLPCVQKAQTQ
jgi:hypothetical protein